jgi:ornithine cyclodeaminase/alanine dehydrogenase
MSAFVLRSVLTDAPATIGFIGCGLQASFHLKTIHSLFPTLTNVLCYSRSVASANALAAEAELAGITSEVLADPEAVITGSQIIVSSIPLVPDMRPFLSPNLVNPGSVLLAIDLARPWHTEGLSSFELKITDDHKQQAQLVPISSTLGAYGSFDADLADIAAGKHIAFDPCKDRAVFAFRGFSLADLGIANLIFEQSRALALGSVILR